MNDLKNKTEWKSVFEKKGFKNFTAKTDTNNMRTRYDEVLKKYAVTASERVYNSWVRNPLAIQIFKKEIVA